MKGKKSWWLILLGLAASAARADQLYTLQDCFQAALQRSEILADQAEQIIQAEEHYRQALGNLLPTLTGQAAYGRQGAGPGGDASAFSAEPHYIRISAGQPLFRGFREYAALRQTRDLIQSQRESKRWAALQLYSDVAQAFYNVLAWQKDLEHLDAQITLYDKRIQDLQARVAIGRSRVSEVLSVQSAQALVKAQRQQTAGQLEVNREILAFLTGLDPAISLQADPGELPRAASLETCLAKAEERPDILAARQQLEAVRCNVGLASGGHWPSLDLNGNYYLSRTNPDQNPVWDAQIAMTLPIFMGGTVVSKTREAESQVRQSELALSRLQRAAAEDIRSQYRLLQSDISQWRILDEALQLAQKNYQAVLRDYNLGLVTILDVLQTLTSYQDTLRSVDHLRYAIQNDFERLEALTAQRPALTPEETKP